MRAATVSLVLAAGVLMGAPGLRAQSMEIPDSAVALRLAIDPEGTTARYRVREQLARLDFPNDAVGETSEVRGSLALGPDGAVVAGASRIVVDLAGLTSDADRRDEYVRRRTLETDDHPTVVLVPTELRGAPFPLPDRGQATFQLVGDLTVRGVTRSTVWDVEATFEEGSVRGTATTAFTFDEFEMEKPTVAFLLSVDDRIRLELDFRLVEEAEPTEGGEWR